MRVPPVGACWDDLKRWRLALKGEWIYSEHNNIQEARTIVLSLKHVCRSQESWDRRLLVISDSLVAIGVLSKGRSSRRALLRQARIAAAYLLGFGLRLVLRYTPSKRNWADGPSRQQSIGVAKKLKGRRLRVPGWDVGASDSDD